MTSRVNINMQRALQIIPNKIDKSITLIPDKPFFSLLWLHGLGDSSAGFLDYFQLQQSPAFRGAKITLLQAPARKVTINGGFVYNSWYDIKSFGGLGSDDTRFSLNEIKESLNIIDKNVQNEVEYWRKQFNLPKEDILKRIFIGGFSQGCAMSLTYGLTSSNLLAGIVGFSGHLFESFELKNKGKIPVLAYHGVYDDVLNYKWVKSLYDKHFDSNSNFEFKGVADLSHSVTIEQLSEASDWMMKQLHKYKISE